MPATGDSTVPLIFSVSTSATSPPTAISTPSSTSQRVSRPSFIDRPHFGMLSLPIVSVTCAASTLPPVTSRTASAIRAAVGHVQVLQRRARTAPACAAA